MSSANSVCHIRWGQFELDVLLLQWAIEVSYLLSRAVVTAHAEWVVGGIVVLWSSTVCVVSLWLSSAIQSTVLIAAKLR